MNHLRLFNGSSNPELAEKIAAHLGIPLGSMSKARFSDGEIWVQIKESVRGADAFVIQSGCCPVNDNVMELLIIIDALRRASARRINVVMPYYSYARQDKKVKPREPITAKLLANLITAAGAHRILTLDLHAGQIQGFFDVPVDNLYAGPIIANYLLQNITIHQHSVVVSPDVGGVTRARAMAEVLGTPIAIIVKRRPEPNKAEVMEVIGDIVGRSCIMIDDMIDTAGSITSGARALAERGAKEILAACTHGVLSGDAVQKLENSPIKQVIITDTIPLSPEHQSGKIKVLSVAPLLADAIWKIHEEGSVSEIFNGRWTG
ncbi:MAG TPA: ribose-phosphate pyrophosphokinase [Armatimonadota bacterium]|nr:ribose-phosphate pyrophosphokinase [Armatimonadota bacterium]